MRFYLNKKLLWKGVNIELEGRITGFFSGLVPIDKSIKWTLLQESSVCRTAYISNYFSYMIESLESQKNLGDLK